MRVFIMLLLGCYCVSMLRAQDSEENFMGWNHHLTLGADINQILQINPKVGEEGANFRWGFSVDLKNLFLDHHTIFDNQLSIELGGLKNGSDAVYDPLRRGSVNPFKKSYDQVQWRTKISRELDDETHYVAVEHFLYSSLTASYPGNYFKATNRTVKKLSAFLSPMYSTFSVGYERRHAFFYNLYVAPLAIKTLVIANSEIAALPALNVRRDSVEFLGSGLHGNELEYDLEKNEVTSFRQSRLFIGAQLVFNYSRDVVKDKLSIYNETRLFFDYLDKPSVDINFQAEVRFVLVKGLQLVIIADLIRDNNQFFQSSQRRNSDDFAETILKRGTSYTQRLALRYSFEK